MSKLTIIEFGSNEKSEPWLDFAESGIAEGSSAQNGLSWVEGKSATYRAGDTLFVPRGTPNAWKSEHSRRQIYCIFQPAS